MSIWNPVVLNSECISKMITFLQTCEGLLLPLQLSRELHLIKLFSTECNTNWECTTSLRGLVKIACEKEYSKNISQEFIVGKFTNCCDKLNKIPCDDDKYIIYRFFRICKSSTNRIWGIICTLELYSKLSDFHKLIFKNVYDMAIAEKQYSKTASLNFETKVDKHLLSVGARFVTEEHQKLDTTGNKKCTPDFLFTTPITITVANQNNQSLNNIHTIHWMDAKNFVGVDIPFIKKYLIYQASKYNAEYGPGAFVFNYGICDGFTIPNTLLLTI